MNKEKMQQVFAALKEKNHDCSILPPGAVTPQTTADWMIQLLQAVYVEHGITKNSQAVVEAINRGDVLSWFAIKNGQPIATASLIRQQNGAWELGRAVSLERGNGIGKQVMLAAALHHHILNPNKPLTAEVRVANRFANIPSGEATQRICFGLLALIPHALAPLFSHGDPLRHEPFVLAASDIKPNQTITERIREVTNSRSTKGVIPRLKVAQEEPFRLIVPDSQGDKASAIVATTREASLINRPKCSLFAIEATDANMPLIGMLSANPAMVLCGIDRTLGRENKPVLLIGTISFKGCIWDGEHSLLAPAKISQTLPQKMRKDLQGIADQFTQIHRLDKSAWQKQRQQFWKIEMNWPEEEAVWEE